MYIPPRHFQVILTVSTSSLTRSMFLITPSLNNARPFQETSQRKSKVFNLLLEPPAYVMWSLLRLT